MAGYSGRVCSLANSLPALSKMVKDGTWDNINRLLIANNRLMENKEWQPKTAIIDSQTTKNSSTSTENIGVDGGKLIKGRKRFYIVDTLGNLLDSFIVPANLYDGTTAIKHWRVMY